ncbi:MAG: TIGR02757 family protein [Cyclobacteriaceae bacterium]|nr:TIGR02757 family protein [Cyclobacteriaceae bacterium]MCH8516992.1 TIGR02757 family protein [Cyclobacteriaceae bacterium]
MNIKQVGAILDKQYKKFNNPAFITNDPILIPHRFSEKRNIEIAGFFAAILAWGQRKTIINKSIELMNLMDNEPYEFILHHNESDLKRMMHFKHRTFTATDLLYFIDFLQRHYRQHASLEAAFVKGQNMKERLTNFNRCFFDVEYAPHRTQKHIATPKKKSACKRLNMFLRWMVRDSKDGVDFGIWKDIKPSELMCPCDVHVGRIARNLGLLHRKLNDWEAVEELTENLRRLDPYDPVKYDLALFSIGVEGESTFG